MIQMRFFVSLISLSLLLSTLALIQPTNSQLVEIELSQLLLTSSININDMLMKDFIDKQNVTDTSIQGGLSSLMMGSNNRDLEEAMKQLRTY